MQTVKCQLIQIEFEMLTYFTSLFDLKKRKEISKIIKIKLEKKVYQIILTSHVIIPEKRKKSFF